jgi:hypothetical protein
MLTPHKRPALSAPLARQGGRGAGGEGGGMCKSQINSKVGAVEHPTLTPNPSPAQAGEGRRKP